MRTSKIAHTQLTTETSFLYLMIVFAIRMAGISMITMPATTAGLNELPQHLMPHGMAMNNTMRQVAASIGTGLLITVMTSTALNTSVHSLEGLVHGVNVSFYVATVLSLLALILAFYIKEKQPKMA